jgi:hypothetical protein
MKNILACFVLCDDKANNQTYHIDIRDVREAGMVKSALPFSSSISCSISLLAWEYGFLEKLPAILLR